MGFPHPYWDFDNQRFAELAVDRLAKRGRRRLALLAPPGHLTYAQHMTAGFLAGIARADALDVPIRTVTTDSPYDAVQREIAALMTSSRRPDGIVCGSAASAISTITAAESCGLVIGRDLDVAVKESFDLLRRFRGEVLVVHEDFRAAGRGLADAVVRTIDGAAAEELQFVEVPD
jgi:LacI family transcriptional regulator